MKEQFKLNLILQDAKAAAQMASFIMNINQAYIQLLEHKEKTDTELVEIKTELILLRQELNLVKKEITPAILKSYKKKYAVSK